MSTKSQSSFSTVLSSFFMLTRKLFRSFVLGLVVKNGYQPSFVSIRPLPVSLNFIVYFLMVLSVMCTPAKFYTFRAVISMISFGNFSPVDFTFCEFSISKIFI